MSISNALENSKNNNVTVVISSKARNISDRSYSHFPNQSTQNKDKKLKELT